GCQKMMMNGCPLIGTMDGANVEIVEEAGPENEFIFGLTADEVAAYEQNGGYDPMTIFNNDSEIRQVLTQLVDGTFSEDRNLFKDIYDSLLTG
ncbi:MAG TPA: glycogen phosphorylase, partial [Sarcina sp.]|nr:glycogen phosphorylase [Sarcina sp.]